MKNALRIVVLISCVSQLISAGSGQSKVALPPARPAWTAAIIASASQQDREKTAAANISKQTKEKAAAVALVPVVHVSGADKAALGQIMCNMFPAPLWKIILGYKKDFEPSDVIRTFNHAAPIHTMFPMSENEIISFSKPLYSASPQMNYSQVHVWHIDNARPVQSWAQKLSPWRTVSKNPNYSFFDVTKVDNEHFLTHFDEKAQLRHKNQPEKLREFVYGLGPRDCVLFGTDELVVIHRDRIVRFNLKKDNEFTVLLDQKKMREVLNIKDEDGNDVPSQLHWGAAKMGDQHLIVTFEMSFGIGNTTDYGRWKDGTAQFGLILVNKNTGEITRRYPIKSFVTQIHRLDDKHFISSNIPETRFGGNLATLWHVDSQQPVRTFAQYVGQEPSCIKVVDEDHFMIGCKDGKIYLYHKDDEKMADGFDLQSGEITGIDTIGENHLITRHADNTIKLWHYDYVRSKLEASHAACIVSASKLPGKTAAKSKAVVEVIS